MRGRRPRSRPYRPNRGDTDRRESMLDMGRVNSFMYNAEQIILATGEKNAQWNTILASIVAKASRISTDAAVEFVEQKAASGELPRAAEEPLCRLLRSHSRMR